jgi:hypothetical protein
MMELMAQLVVWVHLDILEVLYLTISLKVHFCVPLAKNPTILELKHAGLKYETSVQKEKSVIFTADMFA